MQLSLVADKSTTGRRSMRVMVIYRSADVDRQKYRRIMEGTASDLPPGAVAHFGGFDDQHGFCVVDVWDSEEQYTAFIPKLRRVLQDLGVPYAEPEVYKVEGVIAADSIRALA